MTLQRYFIMFLCGMALQSLITSGCASLDPARRITRNCPVKLIDYDSPYLLDAIAQRKEYTGGKVYVTENCWHNALVIVKWARSIGVECEAVNEGNTSFVELPDGTRLKYVIGIGIIKWRAVE